MNTVTDADPAVKPASNPASQTAEHFNPKMILPVGRGYSGKSFWARWLVHRTRARGQDLVVVDADAINPSLAPFLPDVLTVPPGDGLDRQNGFEAFRRDQIARRYSSILDTNTAYPLFERTAQKLPLGPFLKRFGVSTVAVHLIGPDRGDINYLRYFDDLIVPEATIFVLNQGDNFSTCASRNAFADVLAHPDFKAVVARGATQIVMPNLVSEQNLVRRLALTGGGADAATQHDPRFRAAVRFEVDQWLARMEFNFAPVAHLLP